MTETLRSIARIEKTHGRKGEVVAEAAHGLPFLLKRGMEVALVPPELKGPRWRSVTHVSSTSRGQLVGFSGIHDIDAASRLVGKTVLARVADLPDGLELQDLDALLGREVCDRLRGPLGTIEEILVGPANDVWVVHGARGEVLIPAVDGIVADASAQVIEVELPYGLVEGE